MCTLHLGRLDFIHMKKECSQILSMFNRLGLVDSTGSGVSDRKEENTELAPSTVPCEKRTPPILELQVQLLCHLHVVPSIDIVKDAATYQLHLLEA